MASKEKINELIHCISQPPSLNIYLSGISPYPYELEGKLSLGEMLKKWKAETKPNKLYKSIPWSGLDHDLSLVVPNRNSADKLIRFLLALSGGDNN